MKTLLSLSGGRSSAYMVWLLLQLGKLPRWNTFQNTSMESPQTYELIRAIDEQWLRPAGKELSLLEFCFDENGKRGFREVSHDELKKNGEVFKVAVAARKAVPNRTSRQCTLMMKVEVQDRFARSRGAKGPYNTMLGIRHDEGGRVANMLARNDLLDAWSSGRRECQKCAGTGKHMGLVCESCEGKGKMKRIQFKAYSELPLVEMGVTRADVLKFWQGDHGLKGLSFDPGDVGCHLSNCVGCFYGNPAEIWRMFEERPDLVAHWQEMEDKYGTIRTRKLSKMAPARLHFFRDKLKREPSAAEFQQMTFHDGFSMREFAEWRERIQRGEDAPLFRKMLAEGPKPGGCGNGMCGVDL